MGKLIIRVNEPGLNEKRTGYARKVNGKRYLVTWFTYGYKLWKCDERYMERLYEAKACTRRRKVAYCECPRWVLYREGAFYRYRSNKNERHEGDMWLLEPMDGDIWTYHMPFLESKGLPKATIRCESGVPVGVEVDGEWFEVTPGTWPTMEAFLGLDEHYKAERFWPENVGKAA